MNNLSLNLPLSRDRLSPGGRDLKSVNIKVGNKNVEKIENEKIAEFQVPLSPRERGI